MKNRLISGIPTLVALVIIWATFLPWAIGQYEYIRIRRSYPSYIQIGKLEKLVDCYPDIYALEYLSNLQLRDGRIKALQKTLAAIEENIPHYRYLDRKKMLLYLMLAERDKLEKERRKNADTKDDTL